MYFPLVVTGALLIEPTESENKETLDLFCDSFIKLFEQVQLGNIKKFLNSPQKAPWLRLDEVHAGRSLNLRWTSLD